VIFGNRGFSAALLAGVVIVYCWVLLLAISVDPTGAQTGGTIGGASVNQSNEDCADPQEVETVTGSGDEQSPVFDITGRSFRLTATVEPTVGSTVGSTAETTAETTLESTLGAASFADVSIFVYPEGEDVDFVTSFDVEGGGTETSIVNAGPGSFYLDILAANADYEVLIEDCTGDGGDRTGRGGETIMTRTIPRKPLPPTGGAVVYAIVGVSVLTGAGLLAAGIAAQRGRER
jgi:hypothetical protein